MTSNTGVSPDSDSSQYPPIPELLPSNFDRFIPGDDDNDLFGRNGVVFEQPCLSQTRTVADRLVRTPEWLRTSPPPSSEPQDLDAYSQIENVSLTPMPDTAQHRDHWQPQCRSASNETPSLPHYVANKSMTARVTQRLATQETIPSHTMTGMQHYTGASNIDRIGRPVFCDDSNAAAPSMGSAGFQSHHHTPPGTPQDYAPAGCSSHNEQNDAISESDDNRESTPSRSLPRYRSSIIRNRSPVRRSDDHERMSSHDPSINTLHTIDGTFESGRNLLVLFDNDSQPRTRCRIRVERARTGGATWAGYPAANEVEIPAGLTLEEVCQRFPNHVWGSGIRMFMHENWNADRIWKHLPADARHNRSRERPHNYYQQAIGREKDRIHEETHKGEKRRVLKRKCKAEGDDNKAKPSRGVKKGRTPQQPAAVATRTVTGSQITGHRLQHALPATSFGTNTSFPSAPASSADITTPQGSLTLAGPSFLATATVPATSDPPMLSQQPQQRPLNRSLSAQRLEQLVHDEAAHQDWITQQMLALSGHNEATEAGWVQQLHNQRQFRNEQDVDLVMRTHGFVGRSPVNLGDTYAMIAHILRYGTPQQPAEPLSEEFLHWRALTLWLKILKSRTRNMQAQLTQFRRPVSQTGTVLGGGL